MIKDDLQRIKEGLKKEIGLGRFVRELGEVIEHVPHASSEGVVPQKIEARLERIEALLRAIEVKGEGAPSRIGKTWANVATSSLRQASAPQAMHPERHTVQVQIAHAKGLGNEEILREVKKTITRAVVVRVLHSGDIDVTVPNESAKDRAQGLLSTADLKILRKDYLVEVPGVPLSVPVAYKKGVDNARLTNNICEVSHPMTLGIQISWIRWLHNENAQVSPARRSENVVKTRGSLIVGFPTQDMQRRAIRGGLIINAQLFDARLFERGLLPARYFQCQQWGHMQKAYGQQARYRRCVGVYNTRKCPRERVSCTNCGGHHQAWQARVCPSYQRYYQGLQQRRVALYAQVTNIRSPSLASQGGSSLGGSDGQTAVSRKRVRAPSPTLADTQRRIRQLTFQERAVRDIAQQQIVFQASVILASQVQSSSLVASSQVASEVPLSTMGTFDSPNEQTRDRLVQLWPLERARESRAIRQLRAPPGDRGTGAGLQQIYRVDILPKTIQASLQG